MAVDDTLQTDLTRVHQHTRFPHIEGQLKAFIVSVQKCMTIEERRSVVTMEGTVKLDGMHADIVFDVTPADTQLELNNPQEHTDNMDDTSGPRFQTRNTFATTKTDMYGFPSVLLKHTARLRLLKHQVLQRHQGRHPAANLDTTQPLIIAGEWSRGKSKDALGFDGLPKTFVITSISLNGTWQPDADFAGIEVPEIGVYHILRGPAFTVDLDLRDLTVQNPAFELMQQHANEVEECDPFVRALGKPKEQCRGDGIVWKIGIPEGRSNARLWLKTKGPIYKAREQKQSKPSQPKQEDLEARSKAAQFAEQLVTERRVEQGLEYLQEMQLPFEKRNMKTFLDWVANDVMREEETAINEGALEVPLIRLEVVRTAREEFLRLVAESQG